jgi:predicted ATPase/DNA-binding SARP family transcriptional activator/DNA-binding CsgD family transcriptional regulator
LAESVYVRLLGGFRVSVGSRTIEQHEWRLRKAAALIKLLALAPRHRLHREQVMDLLWPDSGRKAASNSLRRALHATRSILDPSVGSRYLVSEDESLVLSPNGTLWVDAEAFEEAAAMARRSRDLAAYRVAIDLYAGELLPEDRYEEWAEEKREILRATYLSLLVELAALYEERGEYGPAVEVLRSTITEEPTYEEAHAGLIRLYALSDQRGQALAQYQRLREVLSKQLGTEPSTVTRHLHEQIAAGKFPTIQPTSSPLEEPPDSSKHNLPAPRSSFVGREQEIVKVKRELAMTRFLTLTGVGGSGKTRLALEVARDLIGAYPDGVWLVELAPLSEGNLVPQAVAGAMGVREHPGQPLIDTLIEAWHGENMLLILDNCEHLIDGVAHFANTLLDCCPRLRILTTSREALRVEGEVVWRVPALSLPEPQLLPSVSELEGSESARLFSERARQRDPAFAVTPQNAPTVAEICRKLEGIPLAIELAAARVGSLSVEQMVRKLEDSLKLLTSGNRTAPARQQTLRGTLDWSYELLSKWERVLFRRLSAFAGGFTLEAAEALEPSKHSEDDSIVDLLSQLVDKSLVVAETGEGGVLRYRMLEPTRQYALERLEMSGEEEAVRRQHAAFFIALAEEAEPELTGSQQKLWLDRLEAEHENMRAALSWLLETGEAELGLRLGGALWRFWYARGYLSEGRKWLQAVLASGDHPESTSVRARALGGMGWLAELHGDYEPARAAYEESLKLSQKMGDKRNLAASLNSLGSVALSQGDYERARTLLEESLSVFRELGNERNIASGSNALGELAFSQDDRVRAVRLFEEALRLARKAGDMQGMAVSLNNLGYASLLDGDWEQATEQLEESLALARELGDMLGTAITATNLGLAALIQGNHLQATVLLRESLALLQEIEDENNIADCLETIAGIAGAQGSAQRAARLWGAAQALREDIGLQLLPRERDLHEPYVATARSRLDEAAWKKAWAEGRAMTLEEAVEYALSEQEAATPLTTAPEQLSTEESLPTLTPREQEIAALVAQGLTNRQIASELSISEHTAATHIAKILKKLGLRSRTQIDSWLAQEGSPPSDY